MINHISGRDSSGKRGRVEGVRSWHNPLMLTPEGPLPVGSRAPGFVLRRTFEESVDFDDLLGKGPVVVAFYVFDFGNI